MAEQDFQDLLNTINKINSQLTTLTDRINTVQKEISSGHWGTGQLREFRQELDRLTQAATGKRVQLDELVGRKELALATKDFDQLSKSIDTLQQRIALGKGMAGLFKTDDPQYQKLLTQIANAERALKAFESRKFTQFTPFGTRRTDEPFEPVSDLGARLAGQPSQSVGNSQEIRRRGREAAERMLNMIQNELLRGAIEARANERQNDILRQEIARRQARNPVTDIPGGADEERVWYNGAFRRAGDVPPPPPPPGGGGTPPDSEEPPGRNESAAQRRERLRREEERLIQNLRQRIAAEEKYRIALEQAAKLGFDINNLKKVQTRGTAGIEQLQFEKRDSSGINQRFDTYVQPSGRATPGISNQFRSFGQGVLRDIGELTKWSLALAAVYGPMRKLQELTQIMIENQTRLAEAAISVSSSFLGQEEIFNAAAASAERAGESIEGVIDAFTLAYRAAGGGGDEIERFATATELLDNALVLSKLSTLDQATAIDTLAAAMRQTSGELTGSLELLDSWVRVTKVANVDLASLATGFAVLGDAALEAGLSTDDLNGVIAAIGETGVTSGRELANTARAIVAGFQSDQAVAALENLGIATKDTEGNLRSFLDISREVNALYENELISSSQLSELGLDIGGGSRRGAAVTTFLKNIDRVFEVSEESSRASGDAQQALAAQLDTVQTSLTRLGNAFQELAQTMGTEGGFLDLITASVNGLTGIVRVIDDLTSVLGKATPALLAFGAAFAVTKYRGHDSVSSQIQGFGRRFSTPVPGALGMGDDALIYGAPPGLSRTQRAGNFISTNLLGSNVSSGGFQGLLLSALPALMNFTNKEDRYGTTRGVADLTGGIIGGVLGALTGPQGALIGATIGVSIAEAFVNTTVARKTDIFGYTAPSLGEAGNPAIPETVEDLDAKAREAEINLYKALGFGSEGLGKVVARPGTLATDIAAQLNEAIQNRDEAGFKQILEDRNFRGTITSAEAELSRFGVSSEMIQQAFRENRQIEVNPESYARQLALERGGEAAEALRELEDAIDRRNALGGTPQEGDTAFALESKANAAKFGELLDEMKKVSQAELRQDRISGDVRGAEYGRKTTAISGFDTRALQYYTALGDEVSSITGGATDAAAAFDVLNNVIVGGSEEALPQLTALSGEIQTIVNQLATEGGRESLIEKFGSLDAAKAQLSDLRQTLAAIIEDINKEVLLGQIQVPDVQGDITKPLTQEEFGIVSERAKNLQDEFYQGFLQIPDDMYDAMKGSFEEWAQIVEESGDIFYERVNEIDPQFFQQAMQQLLEENKLASQETNPFGIQQVDMESSRAGELQNLVNYFTNYLSTNFPQYQQNPEDVGVIFNDYVTSVLHGDNLAIKLALEKLVDLNQKQLDGMYNIPEGATFWVPLTAAYYRPQNNGGAGGLPPVDSQAVDGNTSATDRNTMAVNDLTLALYQDRYDKMQTLDKTSLRHEDRYDKMNTVPSVLPNEDRYDKMNTVSPVRAEAGIEETNPITGFLNELQNWFRNLWSTAGQEFPNRQGPRPEGFGDAGGGYRGAAAIPATQSQPVQARLQIEMDNTTQLVVDGRILASVISPYLAQEMVRLEASQGTITRRFVI